MDTHGFVRLSRRKQLCSFPSESKAKRVIAISGTAAVLTHVLKNLRCSICVDIGARSAEPGAPETYERLPKLREMVAMPILPQSQHLYPYDKTLRHCAAFTLSKIDYGWRRPFFISPTSLPSPQGNAGKRYRTPQSLVGGLRQASIA